MVSHEKNYSIIYLLAALLFFAIAGTILFRPQAPDIAGIQQEKIPIPEKTVSDAGEKKPASGITPPSTVSAEKPFPSDTATQAPADKTLPDMPITSYSGNPEYAKVIKVIDGDTIQIEDGRVVRYIGIDTPESVDPRRPVQCFGREAADKNRVLVMGKTIAMEKDISETDKYGRILRYVYSGQDMVNLALVREGYAYSSSYPPDTKYQEVFRQAEREARESKAGMWKESACPAEARITTSSDTSGHKCAGKTRCREMRDCSEAIFYLKECGIATLDGDGDGVPCETMCK